MARVRVISYKDSEMNYGLFDKEKNEDKEWKTFIKLQLNGAWTNMNEMDAYMAASKESIKKTRFAVESRLNSLELRIAILEEYLQISDKRMDHLKSELTTVCSQDQTQLDFDKVISIISKIQDQRAHIVGKFYELFYDMLSSLSGFQNDLINAIPKKLLNTEKDVQNLNINPKKELDTYDLGSGVKIQGNEEASSQYNIRVPDCSSSFLKGDNDKAYSITYNASKMNNNESYDENYNCQTDDFSFRKKFVNQASSSKSIEGNGKYSVCQIGNASHHKVNGYQGSSYNRKELKYRQTNRSFSCCNTLEEKFITNNDVRNSDRQHFYIRETMDKKSPSENQNHVQTKNQKDLEAPNKSFIRNFRADRGDASLNALFHPTGKAECSTNSDCLVSDGKNWDVTALEDYPRRKSSECLGNLNHMNTSHTSSEEIDILANDLSGAREILYKATSEHLHEPSLAESFFNHETEISSKKAQCNTNSDCLVSDRKKGNATVFEECCRRKSSEYPISLNRINPSLASSEEIDLWTRKRITFGGRVNSSDKSTGEHSQTSSIFVFPSDNEAETSSRRCRSLDVVPFMDENSDCFLPCSYLFLKDRFRPSNMHPLRSCTDKSASNSTDAKLSYASFKEGVSNAPLDTCESFDSGASHSELRDIPNSIEINDKSNSNNESFSEMNIIGSSSKQTGTKPKFSKELTPDTGDERNKPKVFSKLSGNKRFENLKSPWLKSCCSGERDKVFTCFSEYVNNINDEHDGIVPEMSVSSRSKYPHSKLYPHIKREGSTMSYTSSPRKGSDGHAKKNAIHSNETVTYNLERQMNDRHVAKNPSSRTSNANDGHFDMQCDRRKSDYRPNRKVETTRRSAASGF